MTGIEVQEACMRAVGLDQKGGNGKMTRIEVQARTTTCEADGY